MPCVNECHAVVWFRAVVCSSAGRPLNAEDPLNQVPTPPEQSASGDGAPEGPRMHYGMEWAVLAFDRPILCLAGSVMISTKFDLDIEQAGSSCRIAFYGNVAHIFEESSEQQKLKLFRVCLQSPWMIVSVCSICQTPTVLRPMPTAGTA